MVEDRTNPTGHSDELLSLAANSFFLEFVCLGFAAPLLSPGIGVLAVDNKLFVSF